MCPLEGDTTFNRDAGLAVPIPTLPPLNQEPPSEDTLAPWVDPSFCYSVKLELLPVPPT